MICAYFSYLKFWIEKKGRVVRPEELLAQADKSYQNLKKWLVENSLAMKKLEELRAIYEKALKDNDPELLHYGDAGEIAEELSELVPILEEVVFATLRDFRFAAMMNYKYHDHERLINLLRYNLELFKTFLSMIRKEALTETFDVNDVVLEVVKTRPHLAHHKRAKMEYKPVRVRVEFNRDALYWILMRFLSNAEWYTYLVEKPRIVIEVQAGKRIVKLIVKDNGVGEERAEEIKALKKEEVGSLGGKSYPAIEELLTKGGGTVRRRRRGMETVVELKLKRAL